RSHSHSHSARLSHSHSVPLVKTLALALILTLPGISHRLLRSLGVFYFCPARVNPTRQDFQLKFNFKVEKPPFSLSFPLCTGLPSVIPKRGGLNLFPTGCFAALGFFISDPLE